MFFFGDCTLTPPPHHFTVIAGKPHEEVSTPRSSEYCVYVAIYVGSHLWYANKVPPPPLQEVEKRSSGAGCQAEIEIQF
jgi:hypothetical protein